MSNSHYHAELMRSYYAAREAWETERESVTLGYATEQSEYDNTDRPVFRDWLTNQREGYGDAY